MKTALGAQFTPALRESVTRGHYSPPWTQKQAFTQHVNLVSHTVMAAKDEERFKKNMKNFFFFLKKRL
uniref:Uncharacterized protein n=1 Tax=Anguilla anguilla TaxID=7936 RepID=A0A0E9XSY2_ANGAN